MAKRSAPGFAEHAEKCGFDTFSTVEHCQTAFGRLHGYSGQNVIELRACNDTMRRFSWADTALLVFLLAQLLTGFYGMIEPDEVVPG